MAITAIGRALGPIEHALGVVWSVGELALMLSRPTELGRDRHRESLRRRVGEEGLHPPIDDASLALVERDGVIEGPSPYRRVTGPAHDRVLGRLWRSSGRGARELVFVCHCYGVPSPRLMSRLFGLAPGRDVDVAFNVMAHHQPGSYPMWPGSGLVSASPSRFVDNLRAAITGARALLRWLVRRHGYERAHVLGFSIGGQLALHLANAEPVDGALFYCPVTDLGTTSRELGLMRHVHPPLARVLASRGIALDDLALVDPLALPPRCPEEGMHVVVQRHDALAPPHQIERIRARRPRVRWHELDGTHLYPADLPRLHAIVREALAA